MFRSPVVDAIVVIIILLLIMGPKRLPGIGRGIGQGMREFKEGITGESSSAPEETPALPEASAPPQPSAPAERAAAPGSSSSTERQA